MIEKLSLYNDLHLTQTLLNCMEYTMLQAAVDNSGDAGDAASESFDLLYLLIDHVGRMVEKAGNQRPDGMEESA